MMVKDIVFETSDLCSIFTGLIAQKDVGNRFKYFYKFIVDMAINNSLYTGTNFTV
jgi:hypothetical protein